jgi:hypothetical protein
MSKRTRAPWQKKSRPVYNEPFLFAGQDNVPFLYRYYDFQLTNTRPDKPSDTDILADILTNHRIYCSNPLNFNDPWDCKPCIDIDSLDDPRIQSATAESLIATQKGGFKADATDIRFLTDLDFLKDRVKDFNKFHVPSIASRWAFCCLSSDPLSIRMWSHYSNHHKGICLEFATKDTIFRGAMKVKYRKEYPPLKLSDESLRNQFLLIKSDVWCYEKEYRLICPVSSDVTQSKESPFILKDKFLSVEGNALKAIIIGCQAEQPVIDAIRSLRDNHAPGVSLKRITRPDNKYLLDLTELP